MSSAFNPIPFEGLENDLSDLLKKPATEPATAAPADDIDPPADAEPVVEEKPAEEKPAGEETPVEETSTEDELAKIQTEKAAEEKPAEEKPAAVEKPAPVVNERDKDLEIPAATAAHLHPKTRKVMEEFKAKSVEARNRLEQETKARTDTETKLKELEERVKSTALPKEVDEELKTLRTRVRELDITKDPAIEKKYDLPVRQNMDRITTILKDNGIEEKDGGAQLKALQKVGYSMKTLAPLIKILDENEHQDEAEELRELVRSNIRLQQEKTKEVAAWTADFDSRKAVRATEEASRISAMQKTISETAQKIHTEDIEELAKTIPFVKRPPEPTAGDSAAVAAAKQKAIAEYEEVQKAISASAAQWNTQGLPPEKVVEAQARLGASAVRGLYLTHQILPRLTRELTAKDAKISALEADLAKFKSAGKLSRAHAAAASLPATATENLPSDMQGAFAQIAKSLGVNTES